MGGAALCRIVGLRDAPLQRRQRLGACYLHHLPRCRQQDSHPSRLPPPSVANYGFRRQGAAMGSEWYVLRDGEKYGPFTSDRMNAGVSDGELKREDLVWCEGMPDWQPAGDVLLPFRAVKDAGSMALGPKK